MSQKTFPLNKEQLEAVIAKYPTPFHIYDEKAIRANIRALQQAFAWAPRFREQFAVKALPNPRILQILHEEGAGTDNSSLAELVLSEAAGFKGEEILLTSNDTPADEFQKAIELGAIINLDDLSHLDYLEQNAGLPQVLCFRYNPGDLMEGNDIIGKPTEAKYGLTREQLFEGYRRALEKGVKRFGLHTMVASNERHTEAFVFTAKLMFELAIELKRRFGIHVEFVNIGGGIGIPYRPEEEPVDLKAVGEGIHALYDEMMVPEGLGDVAMMTESGRAITGPAGWLVSTAIHEKKTYKDYIGLDSCMANLMRPAMYGAYHHKFAIDRKLPKIDIGDRVIIHDTGAHGSAMSFNYNGKLWCAELLLHEDGSVELIRRAQTLDDYFATLKYPGSVM